MKPKVSILTVSFNSAGTIRDTLKSILKQTYPSIEHVIIDGASSDATADIVSGVSPGAIWWSEPDNGLYDAMNKGIARATGEIIGILNSDDFYPRVDVIERVVEVMESENTDSLYGDLAYVDQERTTKVVRRWKAGQYKRGHFRMGWMPPHPTFFVRRHVYQKYGVFQTELRTSADYELMLRFLYKNNVSTIYLPECLVHMRTGGQSNASLRNRLMANKEDRKAWHMNGLSVPFYTTLLKPIRKITQFMHM